MRLRLDPHGLWLLTGPPTAPVPHPLSMVEAAGGPGLLALLAAPIEIAKDTCVLDVLDALMPWAATIKGLSCLDIQALTRQRNQDQAWTKGQIVLSPITTTYATRQGLKIDTRWQYSLQGRKGSPIDQLSGQHCLDAHPPRYWLALPIKIAPRHRHEGLPSPRLVTPTARFFDTLVQGFLGPLGQIQNHP